MLNPKMWWSLPSDPCEPGVRPNSVPNTTNVSSNNPFDFRSANNAAAGRSILADANLSVINVVETMDDAADRVAALAAGA